MILSKRIKTISSSTTGTDFYFPASLWPGHPHSARVSHSSHRHSRPQCHTTALLEVIACVFLCPAAQGSLGNVLDVKSSPNLHVHRNRWDTCAHANSTSVVLRSDQGMPMLLAQEATLEYRSARGSHHYSN